MLRYQDFLNRVVDESRKAAQNDYSSDRRSQDGLGLAHFLDGSLAGLEACRNLSPPQLAELLERAWRVQRAAFHCTALGRYWWLTCFLHEVEWVCNVVSAALVNQGMTAIIHPTDRGIQMVNSIISETEEN